MSLLTRTYTFTDGQTAFGSQVDSEIANVVNTLNSLDQGNTTWTKVKLAAIIPTANLDFSSVRLINIGTPTTAGDAVVYPVATGYISANAISQALSSSNGTSTDRTTTATTQVITSTGGPIIITAYVNVSVTTQTSGVTGTCAVTMSVTRGGTSITGGTAACQTTTGTNGQLQLFTPALQIIDTPTAGSYTYNLTYVTVGTSPSLNSYSLVLVELKR